MKPNLAFFLELGGSLEEWDTVGFFSREISLYNHLADEYFNHIYIFTYGSTKDLHYQARLKENITIVPRGVHSRNYLNNFFYELWLPIKHRAILRRCDIIKTNQNSGSIAAALAKILFRKKLVVRSGYIGSELARRSRLSLLVKGYYLLAEQLSYRICDRALISGGPNRTILLKRYPFLQKCLTIHNNFIDTEQFKKNLSAEKQFDIIYVARFNRDKNHQAILDVLKDTDYSALFIGQGETFPLVKAETNRLGIPVTFLEAVQNEDLPSYYNAARICAFPSFHEGSPKSLLEAMACELPIVALHAPGVSNIISHEHNGLISEKTGFQINIRQLLNDQALCDKLGQSARQTILEDYSFKKILRKEIEIYQNL